MRSIFANQRFSLKQWFAGGAHSCSLRKNWLMSSCMSSLRHVSFNTSLSRWNISKTNFNFPSTTGHQTISLLFPNRNWQLSATFHKKWLPRTDSDRVWFLVWWLRASWHFCWWGQADKNEARRRGVQKRMTITLFDKVTLKWRLFNCVDCEGKLCIITISGTQNFIHQNLWKNCVHNKFYTSVVTHSIAPSLNIAYIFLSKLGRNIFFEHTSFMWSCYKHITSCE